MQIEQTDRSAVQPLHHFVFDVNFLQAVLALC